MHIRVLHQQADHRQARPGGLRAASAAAGLIVGEAVLQCVDGDGPEGAADVLQEVFPHEAEGFFLGADLLGTLFIDDVVDPFHHVLDGGDVALGRVAVEGHRNHGVVPQFLVVKAELLQLLLRFLIGNLFLRDLVQQQAQPLAQLLRFHGLCLPASAVLRRVLFGESRPLFQVVKLGLRLCHVKILSFFSMSPQIITTIFPAPPVAGGAAAAAAEGGRPAPA